MTTTNQFTTALKFYKYLNADKMIPSAEFPDYEEVGIGDGSKSIFFLKNMGIIEGSYTFYYGAAATSTLTGLTESTDYTLDLEAGKITLTSAGKTAVGTNKIFGAYSYNQFGVKNSETLNALNYSENEVLRQTEQYFCDGSVATPVYRAIHDETWEGRYDARYKTFESYYGPLVKLETTVASNFTTGGTTLTLTSGTGFPANGTIYIGSNKVSYTAKSANNLTVPSSTPSIDAGALVRGEVVEISKEVEGNPYVFQVLDPETHYKIDFENGKVELLSNAYFGQYQSSRIYYPANYIIRVNYLQAWHDHGTLPRIPEDVMECVHIIAARRLFGRSLSKAHIGNIEFKPTSLNHDEDEINNILLNYKRLNIGSSPFNKQVIS